jgi:hypothetical protein
MTDILDAARSLQPSDAGDPNHVYELNPGVSKKWFKSNMRLARIGVHGDGSCFYHSVCLGLNLEKYASQTDAVQKDIAYRLRCSLADKLDPDMLKMLVKKTNGKSPKNKEDFKRALCNPKIWADESAIRLFGETMHLNIIFLDMSKGELYCGVHHDDALTKNLPDTIVVLWVNHSHFEPLAEILDSNDHVTQMRVLFQPNSNTADNDLVRTLMSRYATQCKLKK